MNKFYSSFEKDINYKYINGMPESFKLFYKGENLTNIIEDKYKAYILAQKQDKGEFIDMIKKAFRRKTKLNKSVKKYYKMALMLDEKNYICCDNVLIEKYNNIDDKLRVYKALKNDLKTKTIEKVTLAAGATIEKVEKELYYKNDSIVGVKYI